MKQVAESVAVICGNAVTLVASANGAVTLAAASGGVGTLAAWALARGLISCGLSLEAVDVLTGVIALGDFGA